MMMISRRLLQSLLLLFLLHGASEFSIGADSMRRVAILPAFTDFEVESDWRRALSGFDARLQAELLKGWQVEVLSRAGLSTVVFEQKLRVATDPKAPLYRVLPADVVVLPVFDWNKHDLRLYITPVGPSMNAGNPTVMKAKSPRDLAERLPGELARVLAHIGKLAIREPAAASAKPAEAQRAKSVVCALLDPISPEGELDASTVAVAPWIRAGLEQAVASGNSGAVRLVERNEIARLIEEKALKAAFGTSLEANAAAHFGMMLKADLILVPFVHPIENKKEVEMDLFALEVSSGRLLECVSWSGAPGEPLPVERMTAFLAKASSRAVELAGQVTPDDANARHREAEFLMSLPQQWDGLRMNWHTKQQLETRLADAALALNSDDPALLEKTLESMSLPHSSFPERIKYFPHDEWLQEVSALKKTGQLEVMRAAARRVFELPLLELQRQPSPERISLMAYYWNRMGEYQKALDCLTAGGKQEASLGDNELHYYEAAYAYMGLGRYKECAETVLRQKKFSENAMKLVADAYRGLGEDEKEFKMLWGNIRHLNIELDRYARLLDLAVKLGRAPEVLKWYGLRGLWEFHSEPFVLAAGVRARLAAGQKDIAISEAQCALINARRERRERDESLIKDLEKTLADLGEKPLDHLLRAGDFVKLPPDCVIHLIHDQTIDAAHARAVAGHVAEFWGCPVQIWPVKLDARKLSFYKPLGQTLECRRLMRILMEAALPSQKYLGRAFLTREKLNAFGGNGVWGDFYLRATPKLSVVSDHFLEKSVKFRKIEVRPLAFIDAIAVSAFESVNNAIWKHLRSDKDSAGGFIPVPPELFSTPGGLVWINDHDLGISKRTASVLREITWDEIAAAISKNDDPNYEMQDAPLDPKDRPIIEDLSRQLQSMKPETVLPPAVPSPATGNAPGR